MFVPGHGGLAHAACSGCGHNISTSSRTCFLWQGRGLTWASSFHTVSHLLHILRQGISAYRQLHTLRTARLSSPLAIQSLAPARELRRLSKQRPVPGWTANCHTCCSTQVCEHTVCCVWSGGDPASLQLCMDHSYYLYRSAMCSRRLSQAKVISCSAALWLYACLVTDAQ